MAAATNFMIRAHTMGAQLAAVEAGLGLAVLPAFVARKYGLVRGPKVRPCSCPGRGGPFPVGPLAASGSRSTQACTRSRGCGPRFGCGRPGGAVSRKPRLRAAATDASPSPSRLDGFGDLVHKNAGLCRYQATGWHLPSDRVALSHKHHPLLFRPIPAIPQQAFPHVSQGPQVNRP
jgi:hypothetical protein